MTDPRRDDELSVEELENAAGGADTINNSCPNTNCGGGCGSSDQENSIRPTEI